MSWWGVKWVGHTDHWWCYDCKGWLVVGGCCEVCISKSRMLRCLVRAVIGGVGHSVERMGSFATCCHLSCMY